MLIFIRMFVRSIQVCLELSILILRLISSRCSLSGLSQVSLALSLALSQVYISTISVLDCSQHSLGSLSKNSELSESDQLEPKILRLFFRTLCRMDFGTT